MTLTFHYIVFCFFRFRQTSKLSGSLVSSSSSATNAESRLQRLDSTLIDDLDRLSRDPTPGQKEKTIQKCQNVIAALVTELFGEAAGKAPAPAPPSADELEAIREDARRQAARLWSRMKNLD